MGTKLKNIKYFIWIKALMVFLVWLSLVGVLGSLIYLSENSQALRYPSYLDTYSFKQEYSRWIHNTVEFNTKSKPTSEVPNHSELETNDNESSEPGLSESENMPEITDAGLGNPIPNGFDLELNAPNAQELTESESLIQEPKENTYRYNTIKNRLDGAVNFLYYFFDPIENRVVTNISESNPLEYLNKQFKVIDLEQWVAYYENDYYDPYNADYYDYPYAQSTAKMLKNTQYQVYTALKNPLMPGDVFYEQNTSFNDIKENIPNIIALGIVSCVILLTGLIYLLIVAGRKSSDGPVSLTWIDKIPSDVLTGLMLIMITAFTAIMSEISRGSDSWRIFIIILTISIDFLIALVYLLSLVRQAKGKCLFRNTLVYKIIKGIRNFIRLCMNSKLFKGWVITAFVAFALVNSLFGALMFSDDSGFVIGGFLLTVINLGALFFFAKALRSIDLIMKAAKEISSGNLEYRLDTSKLSVAFMGFGENIQSIQGGLRKAVNEAIKGERMKTELITNVSHDLKTPLTSIVNYVDLLKKEELNNDKAKDYIRVLDEKSARLKHLIEDLVEASKASSGNLTVQKEKIDLHELILQAGGEFEERIEKANLDLRISAEEKPIWVSADGKHMWRIVENLFTNIVKYSMPNTRVYVTLSYSNNKGILTLKNISAFPLDISADQLTERFVRGDESRTTEGSGLGLSIAQSLTLLQGGEFKLNIDGDLFKIMVEMPLWRD